jgi:hypothetical protein
VVCNDAKIALESKGEFFTIELEKLHFIMDWEQGI